MCRLGAERGSFHQLLLYRGGGGGRCGVGGGQRLLAGDRPVAENWPEGVGTAYNAAAVMPIDQRASLKTEVWRLTGGALREAAAQIGPRPRTGQCGLELHESRERQRPLSREATLLIHIPPHWGGAWHCQMTAANKTANTRE